MKRRVTAICLGGMLALSILALVFTPVMATTSLTLQQIFNNAYDSTTQTLQLSLSTSTNKDSTALTNTVTYPLELQHETSGSPANGIGVGIEFIQETTGGNETGAGIAAIADDVTSTSEDFSLSFLTMAAGAAMSETLALESTGILTLVNGETIDNATTNGIIAFGTAGIDVQGGDIILQNDEHIANDTNGEVGIEVETALTNAVGEILTLYHTTSGVPDNGLGSELVYELETSAANYEEVAGIAVVLDDKTGGNEDVSISFRTMAGGATRAESLAIESTGELTLKNSGVIDNTVNGTVKIDEPSSATNTAVSILTVGHSTDGTAAAGIGTSIDFETEDDGGATQVGMSLTALTTSAAAATEAYDFVVELMAGGTAVAERLRVASDGLMTFVNSGTISNVANGTMTIDEPSSATNTVIDILTVTHSTSGVAASGIGTAIAMQTEDNGGAVQTGVQLAAIASTTTAGSEDYSFKISTMAGGTTAAERLEISDTAIEFSTTPDFPQCDMSDGDLTPDVSGCYWLTSVSNTGATAISDLDNPVVGATYCLIVGNSTNPPTLADAGYFNLNVAWTPGLDDMICLYVQADNDYLEISRVDN